VTIRSKNWRGAKLVKDVSKTMFLPDGIKKKTCETLEPVR
jgi:hypothetical protein